MSAFKLKHLLAGTAMLAAAAGAVALKPTVRMAQKQPVNFEYVKNNVTDSVARFLFEKTNKRPIVIPVVLGV